MRHHITSLVVALTLAGAAAAASAAVDKVTLHLKNGCPPGLELYLAHDVAKVPPTPDEIAVIVPLYPGSTACQSKPDDFNALGRSAGRYLKVAVQQYHAPASVAAVLAWYKQHLKVTGVGSSADEQDLIADLDDIDGRLSVSPMPLDDRGGALTGGKQTYHFDLTFVLGDGKTVPAQYDPAHGLVVCKGYPLANTTEFEELISKVSPGESRRLRY